MDDDVLVDDQATREAAAFLLARQRLVVAFSGAAMVAALRNGGVDTRDKRMVPVVSGGNIEPSILAAL